MTSDTLCIVSPFESPDVRLAVETQRCDAFAYLHLGRDPLTAQRALFDLAARTKTPFGVAIEDAVELDEIPALVARVMLPWGTPDDGFPAEIDRVWQVRSADEAKEAIAAGARAVVVKGADAAGVGGHDSTFILFQQVLPLARQADVRLFVQGGVGVHTGAAYLGLGAAGLVLDAQVALMPECDAPRAFKESLSRLAGAQTTLVHGLRVLHWPSMPHPSDEAAAKALIGTLDLDHNLLPAGQDIALAAPYAHRHLHLAALVTAFRQAAYGHLRQAQHQARERLDDAAAADAGLGFDWGTALPVVQGPMARVSDTPGFLRAVADAGALPTLALGTATAEQTARMLADTKVALDRRPWAAGLLGFIAPDDFNAQATQILALPEQNRPTAVVIAGGRPDQGKLFEKEGIQAFLHVPAASLLDTDLKAGMRRFIFEGRESGGHVGPLYSTVLWEQQVCHLLRSDDVENLRVLFAGGIHDAVSAAFVQIMSASLVARGAKVGLQMGTAYLLTHEAVTSGAITATFQELATQGDRTVLLESAPGQETRALPTPFADTFEAEKARVAGLDLEPLAKRMTLEQLNLGRARVASKGLDRRPDTHELVELDRDRQIADGLFMVGSLVALHDAAQDISQLHQSVTAEADALVTERPPFKAPDTTPRARVVGDTDPRPEPIAIIGMAGMFPDSPDVDTFWRDILVGHDAISLVPESRWAIDTFYRQNPPNTDFPMSKWGAFLPDIVFDPLEFGIPPTSVGSIEPVQLLCLLAAKRALQDAGYADAIRNGLFDTSVIFGVQAAGELASAYGSRPGFRNLLGQMPEQMDSVLPRPDEDSFAGILSNVVSGRVANRLNCDGRNYAVDAACASSLASLDVACQELWTDRARMVLCGGADLHNNIFDYVMFSATHALSPRGYCATFDQSGDGMELGEGVGVVVLKRLSDAERDGDRVYALIRAVDGSSDGRSLGLTAPNRHGQIRALERTYRMAGILPSQVGLIEAHGTGTSVGDRTELTALTDVMLESGALPEQTWLGSVKSQIGHAKCAAGVASLIRVALCVRHAVIPPTLHLEKPVRPWREHRSPFVFNANGHGTPWWSDERIAGLSGFGFGGTNFHAIVQNYEPELPEGPTAKTWPCELFLFRGATAEDARVQLRQVIELGHAERPPALKDVAYTLATDSDQPVQFSIVAGAWAQLLVCAQAMVDGRPAPGAWTRKPMPGQVAFLFSGQGSQRVGMGRDLFTMFGWLRERLSRHPELLDIWFPPSAFSDESRAAQDWAVTDTRNSEPLLALEDLAVAELLTWLGIKPDMLAGHSFGELPALAYAGSLPDDALAAVSRKRALAILRAAGDDPGAMVAIRQPREATQHLIAGHADLWAVNYNSPTQIVVAGTTPAINGLIAECEAKKITCKRLDVACAFHTPLLSGSDRIFAEDLAQVDFQPPQLTVWSNTTAQPYPTQPEQIRARLTEHLVKPVLFSDELVAMRSAGASIFIEAGPGGTLAGLAHATLPDAVTIRTGDHSPDGLRSFLSALGQYVATGRAIDAARLFEGRGATRIDLAAAQECVYSQTTWIVNGLEAVPIKTWRANGYQHVARSVHLESTAALATPQPESQPQPEPQPQAQPEPQPHPETQPQEQSAPQPESTPSQGDITMSEPSAQPAAQPTPVVPPAHDQLVYAYLQNMRAMLDDQRDIVLTALGTPASPTAAWDYPPAAPVAPVAYAPAPVAYAPQPVQYVPAPQPVPAPIPQPVPQAPVAPAPAPAPAAVAAPAAAAAAPAAPAAAPAAPAPQPAAPAADDTEMAKPFTPFGPPPTNDNGSVLPRVEDLSADQLKDLILEVVSEKTGYPVDMLGMDMDMEADLSIDSIKRLEIMGALSEKIELGDLQDMDGDTTAMLEKLANIRTLAGMVEWLQNLAEELKNPKPAAPAEPAQPAAEPAEPAAEPPAPAAAAATEASSPFENAPVVVPDAMTPKAPADATRPGAAAATSVQAPTPSTPRTPVTSTPPRPTFIATPGTEVAPPASVMPPSTPTTRLVQIRADFPLQGSDESLAGLTFLLTEGGTAAAITAEMARRGARTRLIRRGEELALGDEPVDGLIFVRTADAPWDRHDLFSLAKTLDLAKGKRILVCDDTMSALVDADQPDVTAIQGFEGFVKSLRMEYPASKLRVVRGLTPFSRMDFAPMAVAELTEPTVWPEVEYDDGKRVRYIPTVEAASDHHHPFGGLDSSSVVLALGGSQGISPVLLASIAAQVGGHYILVGRTPRDPELAARYSDCTDAEQVQSRLIHDEGMNDPRQVSPRVRTILKTKGIEDTLRLIKAAGARVEYVSADLRDTQAFRELVAQVRQQYGHIDAVFHAAGVLEDKLLRDKQWDSFERVFQTKTAPLPVIGELLDEAKLVVLFSSVSSAGGNAGQCDYACANSVLDMVSPLWANRHPDTQITTIGWGPWRGKGMVSAGLENELRRQGLVLIPVPEGRRALLAELNDGSESMVIIMGGDPEKAPAFMSKRLGEPIPTVTKGSSNG